MDCSMPGVPVPQYLPEFAQVHIHWISDAIQPSHPLSPSSPAFNLSQHLTYSLVLFIFFKYQESTLRVVNLEYQAVLESTDCKIHTWRTKWANLPHKITNDKAVEWIAWASPSKESACQCRCVGSIPGPQRSTGGKTGNHFSVLAWKISWTEEPGGLQSIEHYWMTEHVCMHVDNLPSCWLLFWSGASKPSAWQQTAWLSVY